MRPTETGITPAPRRDYLRDKAKRGNTARALKRAADKAARDAYRTAIGLAPKT